MQAKHLIIFAIVGIFGLIAFNLFNMSDDSHIAKSPTTKKVTQPDKPLGQQPKAIVDNASSQIAQAQQVESAKMAKIEAEATQ